MYFHSASAFFHMGHYADYVWPAYLVALSILLLNLFVPMIQLRKTKHKLRRSYAD